MAHIVDITGRLEAAVPQLRLSEDEVYTINDDKNVILKMQSATDKLSDEESIKSMGILLESLLGKEQLKEVEKNHPGATTSLAEWLFCHQMHGGDSENQLRGRGGAISERLTIRRKITTTYLKIGR